jgi:WD40-like Beta Propeller Repeat
LKGRDLAILAAVVLLGALALADSLRDRGTGSAEPPSPTAREGADASGSPADAPSDWPVGRLQGALIFTNGGDCRVRVIGLVDGRERPSGRLQGSCRLWAAPAGERIAYSVRGGNSELAQRWFTIVDLAEGGHNLGTFKNLVGDVLWSPDAQRVAWCVFGTGGGRELEVGSVRPRRLSRCPLAYDPDGRLVFAQGNSLVSEDGRSVVVEDEPIVRADWGEDESLLVVLAGGTVRRYDPDGGVGAITLVADREILPSPDNCAVLFEELDRFNILDVGCYEGPAESFRARAAAWSPDGRWVAISEDTRIRLEEIGGAQVFVWPARAIELYWRRDG